MSHRSSADYVSVTSRPSSRPSPEKNPDASFYSPETFDAAAAPLVLLPDENHILGFTVPSCGSALLTNEGD